MGVLSYIRALYIALPDGIGTLYLDEPGQFFPMESGHCSHLNGTPVGYSIGIECFYPKEEID